jgi:hypothetical protein
LGVCTSCLCRYVFWLAIYYWTLVVFTVVFMLVFSFGLYLVGVYLLDLQSTTLELIRVKVAIDKFKLFNFLTKLIPRYVKFFAKDIWKNKTDSDIIFSFVWFIFALIFLWQAKSIYGDVSITLPLFSEQVPTGVMRLSGIDPEKLLSDLSNSYNINISTLQASIRASASTTFWVNPLSAFLALIGLYTQMSQYQKQKRRNYTE